MYTGVDIYLKSKSLTWTPKIRYDRREKQLHIPHEIQIRILLVENLFIILNFAILQGKLLITITTTVFSFPKNSKRNFVEKSSSMPNGEHCFEALNTVFFISSMQFLKNELNGKR
uniref:Uncharacterized protein n=1 Tax=Glossina pallidipes TaxID=7398 RepID=A0A1A9ZWP7_GLOPL